MVASRPPYQFYGRRKGVRLRPGHAALLEDLLPTLRVDLSGDGRIDPADLFDEKKAAIWLEIGFGGGEHLAWQAAANPDIGMIGCEPFVNGVAKLLAVIDTQNLDNVRIHDGDARYLLERLKPESLDRVFLLFPDPWPKARHNKRRFVNQQTLAEIHRILKPGGVFRFASDITDYVRWTLCEIHRHGGFEWQAEKPSDWRERPDDWPETRYEAKAKREGRISSYLSFARV